MRTAKGLEPGEAVSPPSGEGIGQRQVSVGQSREALSSNGGDCQSSFQAQGY